MTYKVYLQHQNETYMRVDAERAILLELADRFTFFAPDYRFMPKYKNGLWDGKIRLLHLQTQTLYRGLIHQVLEFCEENGYDLELDETLQASFQSTEADYERVNSFVKTMVIPDRKFRDFQEAAIIEAALFHRRIIVSATGSGKSLIIYGILQWLLEQQTFGTKLLVLVPSITLVNQMFNDFRSYGLEAEYMHKIAEGANKNSEAPIYIATWQSVYKQPVTYFKQFYAVLGDECHLTQADCVRSVLEKSIDAKYKVGFTGTLDDTDGGMNQMTLEGLFGKVFVAAKTKDLQDRGILASLKIKNVILKYGHADHEAVKNKTYQEEVDHVCLHQKRLNFLAQMGVALKGNTLILTSYVEKHGAPLAQRAQQFAAGKKQVVFIHGATEGDDRERIRALAEKRNDLVIIATYGVFSTGVNITNLHNVVFGTPSKSKIRVLQSIGRGLRVNSEKDRAVLIDIVDDLSLGKRRKNYLMRHFDDRLKYYSVESFEFSNHEIDFST